MTRRPFRIQGSDRPLLDIFSAGRAGTQSRLHFSRAQIEQIARTVRRTPEVMVKVTGGGTSSGSVSAHFGYISRHGELEIETDDGERIPKEAQKEFLEDWHLDLIAGQYRAGRDGKQDARKAKLVHKIVLSMPAPTPPDKVLAAARNFAREKFALQHRYAMVLHTDQPHPHVHMVVKAEGEHGRRPAHRQGDAARVAGRLCTHDERPGHRCECYATSLARAKQGNDEGPDLPSAASGGINRVATPGHFGRQGADGD